MARVRLISHGETLATGRVGKTGEVTLRPKKALGDGKLSVVVDQRSNVNLG